MPAAGTTKPYRPKPADFRAAYVRLGWESIGEHFHANWRCVARWIDEEGRDSLRAERAAFVARQREASRAPRYGRNPLALTAVTRP